MFKTYQLNQSLADAIEELALRLPYVYSKDSAYNTSNPSPLNKTSNPYFSHLLQNKNKVSNYFKELDISTFDKIVGMNERRRHRILFNFQYPSANPGAPHNYHVDQPFPHLVCLYYVTKADGDTFFAPPSKPGKIIRINPQKGRLVVFEGTSFYHASSSPSTEPRITLNINYRL